MNTIEMNRMAYGILYLPFLGEDDYGFDFTKTFLWEEFRTLGRLKWRGSLFPDRNEVHSRYSWGRLLRTTPFTVTDWIICGRSSKVLKKCSSFQADTWASLVRLRLKKKKKNLSISVYVSDNHWWSQKFLSKRSKTKNCYMNNTNACGEINKGLFFNVSLE